MRAHARGLDRHALVREAHEQAVLDLILRSGPVSRPMVSASTGLSRPTVAAVVAALEEAGLVRPHGRTSGKMGRSAVLFQGNAAAGTAIGIDLGVTKLRGAVADLFGVILAEHEAPAGVGGTAVVDQMATLARRLAAEAQVPWSRVQAVTVASPGVRDRQGRIGLAPNVAGLDGFDLEAVLSAQLGVPVVAENDVNLAALGEQRWGIARDRRHFAFLAIGTGVGLGLVVNGLLVRGASGAAGEVGYLPIGADPADPESRRRGAFERGSGASGLLERFRRAGGEAGDVAAVFDAAATGDRVALATLEAVAALIARGILAVAAVVEPELVVLGGGIGANAALAPLVREALGEVAPFPIRIETTALGPRASLLGALATGVKAASERLFRRGA